MSSGSVQTGGGQAFDEHDNNQENNVDSVDETQHPDSGESVSFEPLIKAVRQEDGTIRVSIDWESSAAVPDEGNSVASDAEEAIVEAVEAWVAQHESLRGFTVPAQD